MPRSRLPLALALLAILLVGGGFAVYQQFLAGDEVAGLTLPPMSADPSAAASPADPDATTSAGTSSGTPPEAGDLAGTWSVADGSVVGYRVRERLGGLSALTDAVGRTSAVTGTVTVDPAGAGLTVTAASFEADLSQLTSDDGRRDNRIRSIGLESDRFPTATFVLAEAAAVPAEALDGSVVEVTLTGDLTIHGVTKRVSIPAQAQLNDGRVEVLGTLTFPFSDFGMTPPNVAGFVAVEDDATLEVLVSLARA